MLLTVHGALDHGGAYHPTGRWFREKGFASVALDQHGHDRQKRVFVPRFEVFLDDLERMLSWVEAAYPGLPVFILAHSMGGLISFHFGLRRLKEGSQVRGFVMSAPYLVNAVKTPVVIQKFAGVFSAVVPRMKAPVEDFFDVVTHDEVITRQHRDDVRDGIKASEISMRFGHLLLSAQKPVPGWIGAWRFPLFVVLAGQDKLADTPAVAALLERIDPGLCHVETYPDNYHENFNEINREEIFSGILAWLEERI
ncbi:MAG: alpha/beta fold hydrolase [Bacteroidales bacterium]